MSINLGSNPFGLYLGSTKIGEAYVGNVKVLSSTPVLPSNTLRCKFSSGHTPTVGNTQTLVDAAENIWDIYVAGTDYGYLFPSEGDYLISVIAANTTGIRTMASMFAYCFNLTSVPLFDTSSVTNTSSMFELCYTLTSVPLFNTSNAIDMSAMFRACRSLTSVPLLNTSKAVYISEMFRNCYNVESGALALYTQASTQATPPSSHTNTFALCGSETVTGAAELAQIPSSWGGNGA